jgi:hypothetical protein
MTASGATIQNRSSTSCNPDLFTDLVDDGLMDILGGPISVNGQNQITVEAK